MPGKSSVVFGYSWCATSVLGSQVFGQTLMESCDRSANMYVTKCHLTLNIVNYGIHKGLIG